MDFEFVFGIIYLNLKFSAKFALKGGIVSVYLKKISFGTLLYGKMVPP